MFILHSGRHYESIGGNLHETFGESVVDSNCLQSLPFRASKSLGVVVGGGVEFLFQHGFTGNAVHDGLSKNFLLTRSGFFSLALLTFWVR